MIHPAKKPQPGGFELATFAPSLDAEAGEALGSFLSDFQKGNNSMCGPTISLPWADEAQTMVDFQKVKVNGELAVDLFAERNALRADLEAASKDLPVPVPEPGSDMARLLSANVLLKRRVAELEAKHPNWMKRIQRERQEERERCAEIAAGAVCAWLDEEVYHGNSGVFPAAPFFADAFKG